MSPTVVEDIKASLKASQQDRVNYQLSMVKALRKRRDRLFQMLDKAYENKLCGNISEDIWNRKSKEWQSEFDETNVRLTACDSATVNYYETGVRILELANTAYSKYLKKYMDEKVRLLL